MPVLVVGADTALGEVIVDQLAGRQGEVRAFVSSVESGGALRAKGVKVALGDVSDASHVEAASLNCFSVVFISEAAIDDRERAFAATTTDVYTGWASAVDASSPQRVIWVRHDRADPPDMSVAFAVVDAAGRSRDDVAQDVVRLDDQATLD